MRRGLLFTCVATCVLLPSATASAAHVVHSVRANLDHDAHLERVQVMAGSRANPYGGTDRIPVHWIRVVDRMDGQTVRRRVSPRVEHLPSYRGLKVRDVGGDSRREIFYDGWNGNAGAVPVFAGVVAWSGEHRLVRWGYAPPYGPWQHNGHTYYYRGASVALRDDPAEPGLEIYLTEGAGRASDPDCCPTYLRHSRFHYVPTLQHYRRYYIVWEHL
jgi:hypothetical protein